MTHQEEAPTAVGHRSATERRLLEGLEGAELDPPYIAQGGTPARVASRPHQYFFRLHQESIKTRRGASFAWGFSLYSGCGETDGCFCAKDYTPGCPGNSPP